MKITAMEQAESVNDVLYDVCGDSTRVEGYGLQIGTLRASWGYGSAHGSERYEVHLCEPCFFRTLLGLRRERMVNFMFSESDQDLSNFGRVARDDFFNDGGSSATCFPCWGSIPGPAGISPRIAKSTSAGAAYEAIHRSGAPDTGPARTLCIAQKPMTFAA